MKKLLKIFSISCIIIFVAEVNSFGGKENAELHFFDANGKEVKRPAEKVVKNNKTYYKVVLAENESCAIVKK